MEMQMKVEYKISEELLNTTLTYLGAQPYVQVDRLIQALMGLEKMEIKEVEEKKVEEKIEKKSK